MLFKRTWGATALAVAGLVLLAGSGLERGHDASAQAGPHQPEGTSIIVRFKGHASEQAIAALNRAHGLSETESLGALGLRVFAVPPGASAARAAEQYRTNSIVEFAEVNAAVSPDAIPSDPLYTQGWHLAKIEAPAAWDASTAIGVLVAVCDTGVSGTHEDLAPVLRGDLGWNAASNSTDWSPVAGHGTLVAGALAAAANNGLGATGVAWGAQLIPVRISNNVDGTALISDAVKCIQGAADRGARVINLSYRMAGYASIDAAAAYARQRGAVTLVAAGNDGVDAGWTDFPNFLAVSATSDVDTRMSWSNFGGYVDVAAPGNSIRTTRVDGAYTWASGTSLASPVAAGVAALIVGANPGLTAAQIEGVLLGSADDVGAPGEDSEFGAGRVNARAAVAMARGGQSSPTATPSVTPGTPTPPSTPAATSTPAPTTTPQPTSTPTPSPGYAPSVTPTATPTAGSPGPSMTETFSARVGGKNQPASRSHTISTRTDGTASFTLSWSGKALLAYTVYSAAGQVVQESPPGAKTATLASLPKGDYTIVVRAVSGQASYTLRATHNDLPAHHEGGPFGPPSS